jgi:uncharacterized protein YggT (Ycf19 family)
MVLNLLKAHPLDQIQSILAKSFAQYQLNQRAETLERKLDTLHVQMEPYGPRVCTDWITQWQVFDHARKQKAQRVQVKRREPAELKARLQFLTSGRVVGLNKDRGIILRQYRSRGQRARSAQIEPPGNEMRAILDVVLIALQLYVWIIIAAAVFSWLYAFNVVNPRNQVVAVIGNALYQLTEPLLRPIRRYMPNLGGIDISPIVLILLIFLLQRVIVLYIWPVVV